MIALRPRDQHVWDPRPLPHENEAETKTNYCETETETEKVVSLNISDCDSTIYREMFITMCKKLKKTVWLAHRRNTLYTYPHMAFYT